MNRRSPTYIIYWSTEVLQFSNTFFSVIQFLKLYVSWSICFSGLTKPLVFHLPGVCPWFPQTEHIPVTWRNSNWCHKIMAAGQLQQNESFFSLYVMQINPQMLVNTFIINTDLCIRKMWSVALIFWRTGFGRSSVYFVVVVGYFYYLLQWLICLVCYGVWRSNFILPEMCMWRKTVKPLRNCCSII